MTRANPPLDARAHVFALGCALFWCLTGIPPSWISYVSPLVARTLS